jgi:cation transport ATPase
MIHTYKISGMTCSSCQKKVEEQLLKVSGVEKVSTDLQKSEATITMAHHINTPMLQQALRDYPKYQLSESATERHDMTADEDQKTWLQTYKPILLVFAFITGVTLLLQLRYESFDVYRWMDSFMAGFFLAFSFFKLLDIKGFAESYFSYDIVARKWFGWGYMYPFIELALGLAYLVGFEPVVTNAITLIVMLVSITGVLRSVLNKRKIRCACLGAVFNLPMSTITIIEDGLMIAMSAIMLVKMV